MAPGRAPQPEPLLRVELSQSRGVVRQWARAAEAAGWAPRVCPHPAAPQLREQRGRLYITSLQTSEAARVADEDLSGPEPFP